MKTSVLINICLIFWGMRKNIHSTMTRNKKVISKMKDKLNGKIIEEFVRLRAKMYSLIIEKEEMYRVNGVKKNVVKVKIIHQDFVIFLFEERKFMHIMQSIQSFKHQFYTIKSVNYFCKKASSQMLDWLLNTHLNLISKEVYTFRMNKSSYWITSRGNATIQEYFQKLSILRSNSCDIWITAIRRQYSPNFYKKDR